jgi:predicted Fe-Mo cluster-binding NifX family protein
MRVAVSTESGEVAQHFGRCSHYTIANIGDGRVLSKQIISNPGHEPGFLPQYLADRGVECIIAGGMGSKAESLFRERNIGIIVGVTGKVDSVLESLAQGKLESSASMCEHD